MGAGGAVDRKITSMKKSSCITFNEMAEFGSLDAGSREYKLEMDGQYTKHLLLATRIKKMRSLAQ